MDARDVLINSARRPAETARRALADLDDAALHTMPMERSNSIAWLVWHAARQMDVQTTELSGDATVWESGRWGERLGVERADDDFGFGDTPSDVADLLVSGAADLKTYLVSCTETLVDYIRSLTDDDLDDVIAEYDGQPVERGVRIVSIIDDAAAHLGQACYVRGLLQHWSIGY